MARRALLLPVPTTTYRPPGYSFPDLSTVTEDVRTMRRILASRGFAAGDVQVPESRVTAAAARDLLQNAVSRARAGDLTVIYFSGHGWQFPDRRGDEVDGLDECLVFADEAIGDDWFTDTLWRSAVTGARYVVVVDACHSLSAFADEVTPGMVIEAARETLGRPHDAGRAAAPGSLGVPPGALRDVIAHLPIERAPAPVSPVRRRGTDLPWWRLILAACGDKDEAYSVTGPEYGPHTGGAATVNLDVALARDPGLSHQRLWERVAQGVRDTFGDEVGIPCARSEGPDDTLAEAAAFHPA